jgi:riboflavin kinase/FMN adenylyltransferase
MTSRGEAVQIVYSFDQPVTSRPTVLTIGKFDGVHLGHQALIRTTLERARALGGSSVVMTFDPHPDLVLHPDRTGHLLTSLEERSELIAAMGSDVLLVAPFNRTTMSTPAYDYMQQLCQAMPLRELWVGEGFALGRKREGDIPRLREIGHELGYSVGTLPPVELNGAPVRSSRVRALLGAGDVASVEPLLGRHFSLRGEVVQGDQRGRTIGFPTANLALDERRALPADGVYACYAYLGDTPLPAVTNIGVRPTFGTLQRTVEAHLLDWSGALYGRRLRLDFVQRLRGEQKFSGIEELKAQIAHDAAQARALLLPDAA